MDDKIIKANELLKIQGTKGNYDYCEYMRGMFNGMELIVSLFEEREPIYKESKDTAISMAVKTLSNHLKTNEDYFQGWQSNIAMKFVDEFRRVKGDNFIKYDNWSRLELGWVLHT